MTGSCTECVADVTFDTFVVYGVFNNTKNQPAVTMTKVTRVPALAPHRDSLSPMISSHTVSVDYECCFMIGDECVQSVETIGVMPLSNSLVFDVGSSKMARDQWPLQIIIVHGKKWAR